VNADPNDELPLLHRDERMVVVNKPSGLLVHRSPIDRHETRFALQFVRDQLGQRVHPVHRLDKPTSGALVFALDAEAARVLAATFATREVTKTYLALVRGWPAAAGVIDRPLAAVEDERAGPQSLEPREAVTAFRTLAHYELPVRVDRYPTSRYALVELNPHTGRRHQLRRHLATASHPIVGDSTYGKGRHNRLFVERFGSHRLLLACVRLEFAALPWRETPLVVDAPLATEFVALLAKLDGDHRVHDPGIATGD
jgi:Pseudouridylate synthases, 23S RNA-specific